MQSGYLLSLPAAVAGVTGSTLSEGNIWIIVAAAVIVIGGVANDKVFNTVELFFDGLIDQEEAIKRLRYEKPNLQIAFRSQSTIDQYLHFEGSEQL
mgnify:CR=1 FL=1